MRRCSSLAGASILFAAAAAAQQSTPPSPATGNANFYRSYDVSPIGNGDKVLITLDNGATKFTIIAEPVKPKEGEPVTQWALYANGGVTLYTKTTVTLPNPNGAEGTPVEGLSVARVITGATAPPSGNPPAVVTMAGHQTTSLYTTPPRKSPDFRMPMRWDRAGQGLGRPRIWLLWDGKKEIQVEPMDTKFKDTIWTLPGFGNHIKFLSNIYTEGSPAPRFFYMKRNKDDSITIYGDDDIEKLKAIDKGKAR
ncbi:MAG: hypothetical protein WBY44_29735 [Bryobacteraceae bacterium]